MCARTALRVSRNPIIRHALRAIVLAAALASPAASQTLPAEVMDIANLSGPRFGITSLSEGVVHKIKTETGNDVRPVITQFGWQFEKQFYGSKDGPTALTEAVVLVGGLDQGVALPSLSWLVGVRTQGGSEIGIGPNITPVGVALAIAAGTTFKTGILNVPVNFAFVPSKSGMRVSVLTGFSFRRN